MADIRRKLKSQFVTGNRYANFGAFTRTIAISGFRGVSIDLEFEYPVTAITGLNGAGKSTVGQLLLCGYRKISTSLNSKRFYVKDFFPISVADPKPFSDSASVVFTYETDVPSSPQELTVSRANTEWSGYKRQPERQVEYVGLAFYLPKVERKDLTIYSAKSLKLTDRVDLADAAHWVSRILGSAYDDIFFQGVENSNKKAELGVASRFGAQYSENNMGFGEGRVVHTIKLLETCPEKSLIVLEEPETSLHEFAQYEFAKYLMDVSARRGHQIVFSTHSSPMMDALPNEGRKLLVRNEDGVKVYDRLTSSRIRTALSSGEAGHTIVAVEDVFAQSLLREIIRSKDKDLLSSLEILEFGDAKAVQNAVQVLKTAKRKCLAVRDADQAEILDQDILKLPGTLPPEKEIFLSDAGILVLKENYNFDLKGYLIANPETDHHDYAKIISKKTKTSREVIESDCIRAFLATEPQTWANGLIGKIKERA